MLCALSGFTEIIRQVEESSPRYSAADGPENRTVA
jgi:hypothetical protein